MAGILALIGAAAMLPSCATSPASGKMNMDFVWGCWVQKDAPGGTIEAFLRLLPNRDDGDTPSFSGEVQEVVEGQFGNPSEGLSFSRDGSTASFWVLIYPYNADPDAVILPGSQVDSLERDYRPVSRTGAYEHRAVFRSRYAPDRALVVEATAERLKISQETAGEPPAKAIFDGERDGCD